LDIRTRSRRADFSLPNEVPRICTTLRVRPAPRAGVPRTPIPIGAPHFVTREDLLTSAPPPLVSCPWPRVALRARGLAASASGGAGLRREDDGGRARPWRFAARR